MRQEGELLTDIVLIGSLEPALLLIEAISVSRHGHILFRTNRGRVIDSTAKRGGVTVHPPDRHRLSWQRSFPLLNTYTVKDVETMTQRAFSRLGTPYDMPTEYVINSTRAAWEKRMWCFEFAAVVMQGFVTFDHRPDRAVGRHWLKALKQLR